MKTMLKIKPFRETLGASMCGPASLKIVLSYYGIEKAEKEYKKFQAKTLSSVEKAYLENIKLLEKKVKAKI